MLLEKHGLVIYSWGNVSGIDREAGLVAIKPSGVAYDELTAEKIVLLDFEGKKIEGDLNPSSDTPTHLELYRNFKNIGGICHTHSKNATIWAQACLPIPCMGTTHADYFSQDIPLSKLGVEGESLRSIDDNEMAKIIYRELKRIIQDDQLGDSVEGFSRIFLYGDNVRDGVLEKLQNSFNVKIDKINPFRNVFIGPKVIVDEKISSHPESFTVCVGSALR